jgi:hypothetical protein
MQQQGWVRAVRSIGGQWKEHRGHDLFINEELHTVFQDVSLRGKLNFLEADIHTFGGERGDQMSWPQDYGVPDTAH